MWSTQPSYDFGWADPPPRFSCASYPEGTGVVRVTLTGELDIATAPQLAHALGEIPDPAALVILDLSELTFMDSSALEVIVSAQARLAAAGRRLTLVPRCDGAQRIFERTGTEHRPEFVSRRGARGLAAVQSR
jgi:anti-sigma B factor antagonist